MFEKPEKEDGHFFGDGRPPKSIQSLCCFSFPSSRLKGVRMRESQGKKKGAHASVAAAPGTVRTLVRTDSDSVVLTTDRGEQSAGGGGGGGGGGGDGGVVKLKLSRRKESDASVRSSTVCASGHW